MKSVLSDRREFLKQAGSVAFAWSRASLRGLGELEVLPNPVGYATIAWPRSRFPAALETISHLGFKGVQILGWVSNAYDGPKTAELKEQLHALNLQPAALSCSRVNLYPSRPGDDTQKFRRYAAFFQRLGGLYLQVTDGGDPKQKYSAAEVRDLGARMNEMGKSAQDFGLVLGYHPHFGTIGETREGLGQVLDSTDPRYVKLIADVAHLTLGGVDSAEVIRAYHDRLIFMHFKDVRKEVAALARQDCDLVRKRGCHFCEIGDGVVDFPGVLAAIRETGFRGWIIVELDPCKIPFWNPDRSARKNKEAAQHLGLAV